MLVNALYNVIDRIFVGRGVNEAALGGLSLAMPLMTVFMAFAMLFGVGAANMISMRLGQGRKDEAEQALNHCFWLLLAMGVLFMVLGLLFLEPILSILGAQEGSASLEYTRQYFRIILYGAVFSMLGFGFSHCTRAQGFPAVTMISMLIGAGMNIVLDPIFIFGLGWGVEGAAWATISSQAASSIWILMFSFSKRAVIRLNIRSVKLSPAIMLDIMSFGSSQFLMQLVMSGIAWLNNYSVSLYGAEALGVANGGDVALSAMNIAGSLVMVILMPVFGINQGAQPILGFNYGAKRYDRVLSAFVRAIIAASAICILGFAVAQIFTTPIVRLFTPDGSPALLSFAVWTIRVSMLLLPLAGFQIVSSNMFVVTGRPKTSIVLSLLRQCIALIPCILIFGRIWGLWGVVAATPVADGFSFLVTTVLIGFELKKLRGAAARG
jgi:putative MATE family efflux protein